MDPSCAETQASNCYISDLTRSLCCVVALASNRFSLVIPQTRSYVHQYVHQYALAHNALRKHITQSLHTCTPYLCHSLFSLPLALFLSLPSLPNIHMLHNSSVYPTTGRHRRNNTYNYAFVPAHWANLLQTRSTCNYTRVRLTVNNLRSNVPIN